MHFKPLVSEDEFRAAEAEIEAATRELAQIAQAERTAPAVPATSVVPAAASHGPMADVRPEIRTKVLAPTFGTRALALIGFKAGLRRIDMINKITRTVNFGCARGLAHRPKELATVAALYAMASDPGTPAEELPIALGWIQSLVFLSCSDLKLADVRAV
jgi:hypothetical protein